MTDAKFDNDDVIESSPVSDQVPEFSRESDPNDFDSEVEAEVDSVTS